MSLEGKKKTVSLKKSSCYCESRAAFSSLVDRRSLVSGGYRASL